VEAIAAPVRDRSELETVIAAQARDPNGSLISMPDSFADAHRVEIISLAARYRLPAQRAPYDPQRHRGAERSPSRASSTIGQNAEPVAERALKTDGNPCESAPMSVLVASDKLDETSRRDLGGVAELQRRGSHQDAQQAGSQSQ
jgi:hypothetical protein